MENTYTNTYTKLSINSGEDIKMKPITDFEFIRQRNIYKEKNNNNQEKPYSMLQKTNNIFDNNNTKMNNLDSKIYNDSREQKENINLYGNQNNNNDNNNISSSINRIQNKINEVENNINLINKSINKGKQINFNYENELEKDRIINDYKPQMINPEKNKFLVNNSNFNSNHKLNNKGFYFNYKSDESFKRINEKNTKSFPIDIKSNSIYNKKTTDIISSTNNDYKYNNNSILFNMDNIKSNNNDYYKELVNKIEMRNELIKKDTFDSINKNTILDYNNFNNVNINNNLRKDFSSKTLSVHNNIITQEKYNLDSYISDNLQSSKSNNNIFISNNYNNKTSNDSLYNTEKRNNIKSYFQLKEKDNLYNYNNNYTNNIKASNKSDQTLSSLTDEINKEIVDYSFKDKTNINAIKSLKNYHSFSTSKNHYINSNIEKIILPKENLENTSENYRVNTNTDMNKKDEMTQTNEENENIKFYSLTQNRSYRNHDTFTVDNSSQTYNNNDNLNKKWLNTNINNNKTHYDTFQDEKPEINEENFENIDTTNRQFNTLSNNICQQNNKRCIHNCNSHRNKGLNKTGMNLFKRNNKNSYLGNNGVNRNICEKCFKSKMNLAKLAQMRICNNCRELINNGSFNIDRNNYFTFN